MTNITPAQRTWKIFKQNKSALLGAIVIAVAVLTAVSGYLIMPNDSPNANNMNLPLSLKKPGAKFKILLMPKAEKVDTLNFVSRMLFGQPALNQEIPITSYQLKNDSIIVQAYLSDEDRPERRSYNIFEVLTGHPPEYIPPTHVLLKFTEDSSVVKFIGYDMINYYGKKAAKEHLVQG